MAERRLIGGASAGAGHLNAAYRNFFASLAGLRRGPRAGPPRYRSRKDHRQAVRFTANARFKVTKGGKLRLPKIGDVTVHWSRPLLADPSSVTVIKDAAGRYFASFVVDTDPTADAARFRRLLQRLAWTSDWPVRGAVGRLGDHCAEVPAARRGTAAALAQVLQSHRSRLGEQGEGTGSAGPRARESGQFMPGLHHKTSTAIIRDNQAVYVEDLCVAGLGRTRLAKSIHDASWSSFTAMMEYKAARYARRFGRIGRFEPTSQVCSACGANDGPKPLQVREWVCSGCGVVHDRDHNAAKNVLRLGQVAAGRAETLNACGGQVRPGAIPAPARETGTLPGAA